MYGVGRVSVNECYIERHAFDYWGSIIPYVSMTSLFNKQLNV